MSSIPEDRGAPFARNLTTDYDGVGVNACQICCDRHAASDPDAPAIHVVDGARSTTLTYAELQSRSAAFARLLDRLQVKTGDCIAALVPRGPELAIAALAAWRIGAVFAPLFTAFGEEAIRHRLDQAEVAVLVVDDAHRDKLAAIDTLPVVVEISEDGCRIDTVETWADLLGSAHLAAPPLLAPGLPFLRMFTSGTTGKPKSLDVPLRALLAFETYMKEGIDLRRGDRFWNLADPGWAYGLYYGLIGPLMLGQATLFSRQGFDPHAVVAIIRSKGITNLAGSPTAFRMLMGAGPDAVLPIKGQLRAVSSAGEPLTAEIDAWFRDHIGVGIRDHYGQTELGMVLIADDAAPDAAAPAAGGFALSGFSLKIVDEDGCEVGAQCVGELAVDRAASPLFWFAGYREMGPMKDAVYRTGDMAVMGVGGRISFFGRIDDVITSSGYRIGPYDVESVIAEDDRVLEVAVVGKPDPDRTEIVKAFVVLKPGAEASAQLVDKLKHHVRSRLSTHAYPREIEFVPALPKTPSGKVQRKLLKSMG